MSVCWCEVSWVAKTEEPMAMNLIRQWKMKLWYSNVWAHCFKYILHNVMLFIICDHFYNFKNAKTPVEESLQVTLWTSAFNFTESKTPSLLVTFHAKILKSWYQYFLTEPKIGRLRKFTEGVSDCIHWIRVKGSSKTRSAIITYWWVCSMMKSLVLFDKAKMQPIF